MKIKISADTSCLINSEVLKKNDISEFPLNVIVNEVEYLDGVSINQEQLLNYMNSDAVIKTSTPPPGVIIEYFENLFKEYDKVIHFTTFDGQNGVINNKGVFINDQITQRKSPIFLQQGIMDNVINEAFISVSAAEKIFNEEFAFVLGIEKEKVSEYISKYFSSDE